jgi:hypothetical protein
MSYDDANDFLMGGGGAPTFSWKGKPIGTVCKGTILDMEVSQQTDMDTGDPLVWDDGKPRMQLVVTLQTDLRNGEGMSAPAMERLSDPSEDDGIRRLFVKAQMQKAVRDAVRASSQSQMRIGGVLAVQYAQDGVKKKASYDAPKEYVAQYAPPSVDVNDLIEAPMQPVAAPAPAPQQIAPVNGGVATSLI